MTDAADVAYVSIRNLIFSYPGAKDAVLKIPALDIRSKGLTAITGPSGAGKSTFIELMAGTLREKYSGTISVLGTDYDKLTSDADRQRALRRIGLIPQDYGILPGRTIRQFLQQDLTDADIPRQEHEKRITDALLAVQLESLIDRQTTELSGGQRQRVAIARMLARDVDLVIADEPTANVDPQLVSTIFALFAELGKTRPVIVVTHDPAFAAQCDRTVILQSVADVPIVSKKRREHRVLPWVVSSSLLMVIGALIVTLVARNAPQVPPTSSLAVIPCTSVGGSGPARLPHSTLDTSLSSADLQKYDGYSDGHFVVLAPAGWSCTAASGQVGTQLTLNPTTFTADGQSQGIELQAGSGQVAASILCPFFPSAKQISGGLCIGTTHDGETTKTMSSSVVDYTDPPGVSGNGYFSGSQASYADVGIALWQPYDLSATHGAGFGLTEDCALPPSQLSTCQQILNFTALLYAKGPPS